MIFKPTYFETTQYLVPFLSKSDIQTLNVNIKSKHQFALSERLHFCINRPTWFCYKLRPILRKHNMYLVPLTHFKVWHSNSECKYRIKASICTVWKTALAIIVLREFVINWGPSKNCIIFSSSFLRRP